MAPVAGAVVNGAFSLASIFLQGYFEAMRMAGRTEAEQDQFYEAEKAKFLANRPETLPDPE